MANVIGNLRAILSLNTKSFIAGLTTAGRATKAFRGSMFDMGRGLQRVGSFIGGFVAPGAALYTMINQFHELGDLADLGERLNIGNKALQGFRLAAMDAGISADDTTTALQFMLKTVGEATTGSKEAAKAVSALGISIDGLAQQSSEEILYRIADALQQIKDPAIRAAREVDIFGRSGSKLDSALKGGRINLKAFEQEMKNMGRTFEPSELKRVDDATDKFNRLKESFKGLADVVAVNTAPALTSMMNSMTTISSVVMNAFRNKFPSEENKAKNAATENAAKSEEFERNRRKFRNRNPGQRMPLNLMNPKERAIYDKQRKLRDMMEKPNEMYNPIDRTIYEKRRKSREDSRSMGTKTLDDIYAVLNKIAERGGMVA